MSVTSRLGCPVVFRMRTISLRVVRAVLPSAAHSARSTGLAPGSVAAPMASSNCSSVATVVCRVCAATCPAAPGVCPVACCGWAWVAVPWAWPARAVGSGVRASALAWARLVDALDDVAARELVADALVEAPVFRVLVAAVVVVVFFAAFSSITAASRAIRASSRSLPYLRV